MALYPVFSGTLSALAQRYLEVRRATERLCAPLSAEDQMVQSMPEASPTKWHQAHTTWFFEMFVLEPHLAGYKSFDPDFRFLFNSYYKQLDAHPSKSSQGGALGAPHPLRALRGSFSRPALQQIQDYRHHVDEHVLRLLAEETGPDVAALVELGTHHEQQHQELILTDIKHALWTHPLKPAYCQPTTAKGGQMWGTDGTGFLLEWVSFRGGVVEIGHAGEDFAFDNETPAHEVLLEPYRLGSRLVTNGDYLSFMSDGGYTRPELWLSDGWDRACAEHWRAPLYWEEGDGQWLEFTLSGMRTVEPASSVCHVSYYEADAFARWAGARLPREEEWENAAKQSSVAGRRLPVGNLLESGVLHPRPADIEGPSTALEMTKTGQLFGDVWEWTGSAYLGYPGYRADDGALGEYNGKFMSGQMVLRGGSCATPASHIRVTYRNFFPPHARWQFMGIRLANDGD
jgi:ergothioneine biosynthesis protein EgtB